MSVNLEEFLKKPIYQDKANLNKIYDNLNELVKKTAKIQAKKEKHQQQKKYLFLGLILLIILTFIVIKTKFLIIDIVILIIIIISLIYNLHKIKKYSRVRHNILLTDLTKETLKMLSRDMDSNAEVEIYLSAQSLKDKISNVPHPNKSGWKIEQYKQEWLTLKGKFLDKTYFELTLTELSKTIRGTKRTSSGKTKQKSKTKLQGLNIKLRLTYPQGRYGAVKVLKNDVNNAVKIPEFCQLKQLKVTDKNIDFVVKVFPEFAEKKEEIYQTIAMMFLSVYQILNLAKMLSR